MLGGITISEAIYKDEELKNILEHLNKELNRELQKEQESYKLRVIECDGKWIIALTDSVRSLREEDRVTVSNTKGKIDSINGNEVTILLEETIGGLSGDIWIKKDGCAMIIENMRNLVKDIIDNKNVKLKQFLTNNDFECPVESPVSIIDSQLNKEQSSFVRKTIGLFDNPNSFFYLCWGPGGSGKTRCITEIVEWCMNNNKRVLITSFTNVAVDNLMNNLIAKYEAKIIRLGPENSIKIDAVKKISEENKLKGRPLREALNRFSVMGATLDRIGLPENSELKFDLVVLDESSMIEMPKALLGINKAEKFVMIGDPEQLEPIQKDNGDVYIPNETLALFNKLIKHKGEQYYTQLIWQYRSQESVVAYSSEYVYDNKLLSANKMDIDYEKINNTAQYQKLDTQLKEVFDHGKGTVWVDTSNLKYNLPLYWSNTCNYFNISIYNWKCIIWRSTIVHLCNRVVNSIDIFFNIYAKK
jgi:hypothetical protein